MKESTAQQLLAQVQTDYDTISAHFSNTRRGQWYEVSFLIEQYVQPAQLILDLGCGNGRVADLVHEIKAKYVGMDVSPKLVQIAKTLHPKDEFRVGSMMNTGFRDNAFDHTLMIASFHHIPSEQYRLRVLQEVKRITKPGGFIIMTNWNLHQWHFFRLRMKFALQRLHGRVDFDRNDVLVPWKTGKGGIQAQRYYHGFTMHEMQRLALHADLPVVDQYYETNGIHLSRREAHNLVTVLQVA